jgi:hypothetical protein
VCRDLVLDALCFDRRTTGRARTARAISSRGAVVAGPSPQPTPTKRAQDFRATLRVPVADPSDLSTATQKALRTTRWLGGYVVTVQYGTPAPSEGTANLRVRTPVSRVQAAIVQFNNLGQILEQQTQVTDFQQRLDELTRKIRRAKGNKARIAAPPPRAHRAQPPCRFRDTRRRPHDPRTGEEGSVPRPAGASRRRRDRPPHCRASTRAYALIVARPFLLLLAAAFAGNRVYRRHADQRLLERA